MKMQPGKWYSVAQKVVVRGDPFAEAISICGGYFVGETKCCYKFRGFKLRKACTVRIKEDSEEERNLVAFFENLLK